MWDEVPLEDAVPQVKQILVQTLADKMQWKAGPVPGTFVAERSTVSATLDRVQGESRRQKLVRIRFSPRGAIDFKSVIQQHEGGGEPLSAEIELESYLARLYQVVSEQHGAAPNLVDEFLEDVP
jgi:hypothetical protein